MVVQGLQEKSRLKIMDALRRFIMVDNHEARVCDSEKNMVSRKVVKPMFTTDFPAVVGRTDELTLRAEEEGML